MKVTTSIENVVVSQKQARYFALQVYSEMKRYLENHKEEFEEWLNEMEGEDEKGNC